MRATIDQVCRYWDARPCNVRHGQAAVGTLEWSQQVTARKYLVEPHIPGFAQFARWRGKRVLEVGCGIGTDTLEFLRAGANVHAVDASMKSIRLAWQRCFAEKVGLYLDREDDVVFHPYDAEEFLPPGPFDLAYSFGVLHHTPRPDRVLKNIYDRLAPGGELRVMLYARHSLKFWFGEQPEAQPDCPVVKLYTAWSARKLLQAAGFEVLGVRKTHLFPWRVKDYVTHRYVRRWPYRLMPPWLFHGLEQLAGHHLLVVARRSA